MKVLKFFIMGLILCCTYIYSHVFSESILNSSNNKNSYVERYSDLNIEMIWIPGGQFQMERRDNKDKLREYTIKMPGFWMSRTEITNRQWEVFDKDHVKNRPKESQGNNAPVTYVSWYEAKEYCKWLSRATGKMYSLPTDTQWEYAARGADGRIYPWGNNNPSDKYCNFCDVNCSSDRGNKKINDGYKYTAPVGSFKKDMSPFGILDMAGNVQEWCEDQCKKSVRLIRVIRGGSFFHSEFIQLRTTFRLCIIPEAKVPQIGFRIVANHKGAAQQKVFAK